MSFLSEPKTNMQVYLSYMPMTQAPLTIQPKKLLDVSLTGTTRNQKFTSRTQHAKQSLGFPGGTRGKEPSCQ